MLQDRYLIQRVLGRGGMSSVYQARDLRFPNVTRLVAVKQLLNQSTDASTRRAVVDNFEREANLLATLDHPAIPRIFDYFSEEERSFLVMEFISGRDLESILSEGKSLLPVDKVVSWAIEICDVLQFLHTHNPPVIFRDVKPSNVMIDDHGRVRLVDFGIAKLFSPDRKGTMIGTEGYAPPEQYRGEAGPVSDIYALGATLHHLLTNRDPRIEPPFTWADRPLRELNPQVPESLEKVVDRALSYNLSDRYPTPAEMSSALARVLKEMRGEAPEAVAAGRKTSPVSTPESIEGPSPIWVFSCEDEVRGAPAQAMGLLLVGSYDHNLYALDLETGNFKWKYATEGGISGRPAVREDSIILGSEDHRLHAVSLNGGRLLWIYPTDKPIRSSPVIAVGHVFVGSDDGALHAVNVVTGRRAWRCEVGAPVRSTALVLGDRVYFGCDSGEFHSVTLGGESKWQFRSRRAVVSSPTEANGLVYFGSVDYSLYALDAASGWVVWRFRTGKPVISSPAVADDLVVFGSADGRIYALDSKSSKEKWHVDTEGQVNASPLIHKGLVYCGSVDGRLYCIEAASGKVRWKFATGGAITGAPAGAENVICFGSTDHRVYALPV
jgi:serine/threonine protein kinase